jgi:hypothetical protein
MFWIRDFRNVFSKSRSQKTPFLDGSPEVYPRRRHDCADSAENPKPLQCARKDTTIQLKGTKLIGLPDEPAEFDVKASRLRVGDREMTFTPYLKDRICANLRHLRSISALA